MCTVPKERCPNCDGGGFRLDPVDGSPSCCRLCGGGGFANDIWLSTLHREEKAVGNVKLDFVTIDIIWNGDTVKSWGWSEEALRDALFTLGFEWARR